MDVIAGRKTTGIVEHDSNIFVNGQPKDPKTFASITGYVEQTDMSVHARARSFLMHTRKRVCVLFWPLSEFHVWLCCLAALPYVSLSHNGMATVKEALEFSAKLRLPASVSDATRANFIDEVMHLVGLSSIQNRMIGDASQPSLSTGQLKLLTIAVELVANPAIIFLGTSLRTSRTLARATLLCCAQLCWTVPHCISL